MIFTYILINFQECNELSVVLVVKSSHTNKQTQVQLSKCCNVSLGCLHLVRQCPCYHSILKDRSLVC